MRTFLIYLKLELKKTLKSIPFFLAGAIVLVFLAGTIAFSASKILYGERALDRIEVGVVMPEEDAMASMVIRMISSLDSVGSLCHFTYVDAQEGRRLLKSGEAAALMELPQGFVEGIMDGSNIPVTVIFPESSGVEAAVFRELTEAGTSILGTAQAGIYAADDYLTSRGMTAFIAQTEQELNALFLKYALSREAYFRQEKVSAAGDVGTGVFYGISACVGLLLLLGIPAAPAVRPYKPAMEDILSRMGIGRIQRTAVRTICVWVLLLLVSVVPMTAAWRAGFLLAGAGSFGMWLLLCLSASVWILFHYELCQNTIASILLLFATSVVMLFVSGGIVPSVFLPAAMQKAGVWMPSSFLTDGIRFMVTGQGAGSFGTLFLFAGIVFLLSAAVRRKSE